MTPKVLSDIVNQYIQAIKKSGIPVQDVYLFGSAARGTMHVGSDIDLCIISPIFGKDRLNERVHLMNMRGEISDMLEPHPYSPSDFNNPFDPLSSEIKKTGIRIVI